MSCIQGPTKVLDIEEEEAVLCTMHIVVPQIMQA